MADHSSGNGDSDSKRGLWTVIRRFFEDYKVLENKSVVVKNFYPVRDARTVVDAALKRYQAKTNTSGR